MKAAAPPSAAPFPWDRALAFGFGVLRLAPEHFWRMTPCELAAAIRGLLGEPEMPLDRVAFDQLLRRYPDQPSKSA